MTPEQLERRRASRERWREQHPQEWNTRRARKRSGSPAPTVPDTRPDALPDTDLVALVAALRARIVQLDAELAELRTWRDRERQRSRRNYQRRRQTEQSPAVTGEQPETTGSGPAVRPAPPLARDVQSGPPPEITNNRTVSLTSTTTTTSVRPATGGVVVANAPLDFDVWQDAEVQAALSRRPGLDVEILRARVNDWLSEHPGRTLTRRTVLTFVERWRPAIDEAPRPASGPIPATAYRRTGRAPGPVTVATPDRLAGIEQRQRDFMAGRAPLRLPVGAD